jgi:hypothetical protein
MQILISKTEIYAALETRGPRMVIRILDIAGWADTSVQGAAVLARLQESFVASDVVTVSFDGINTATSSFITAAFVPILTGLLLDDLKRRLRITDSTRQIKTAKADMPQW